MMFCDPRKERIPALSGPVHERGGSGTKCGTTAGPSGGAVAGGATIVFGERFIFFDIAPFRYPDNVGLM